MVIIKVVAMFDDRLAIGSAMDELIASGLADSETLHTEPELKNAESAPLASPTGWERLQALFDTEADHDVSSYAEGLRRGSFLLVVETPNEKAEMVKDVLRRHGAIDLRRRVHRWITTGWQAFDPSSPSFTELEILDERGACVSEAAIAADAGKADVESATVSLFDESNETLVGRITEAEFLVLQEALQEEGPGDDDYWINEEEVATISGRPGATPHLIAVLRRAVAGRGDGVDLRFERKGGTRDRPAGGSAGGA